MTYYLPVHQDAYFTLQNIGVTVCPYQIFSRTMLLADFATAGYELVDSWQERTKRCFIPQHPHHSLRSYAGFYFRHAGSAARQLIRAP